MAIQARISTLRFDNGLGSFRQWESTADVQDTGAGSIVNVEVVQTSGGGAAPGVADNLTLFINDTAGTQIRSIALTPTSAASWSTSFYITHDGTNTSGSPRCGTLEIRIRAERGTLPSYDAASSGVQNTPPAGFSITRNRGWVRGTTTCVLDLSNVSAGGAETAPASWNESIFVRSTLGHQAYTSKTLTLGISDSAGGPAQTGTSNNVNTTVRDVTLSGIVDNRFTAAARTFTTTVTAPNDSLPATGGDAGGTTGAGWTSFTTTTTDDIAADPRITIEHHLQVNNNTYDSTLNSDSRLTSDLGFATWKVTNARGEAISSIVATHSLGDTGNLVADVFSASETTGATGRPASMQVWDAALPGGSWTHVVTITAPSDATGLGSPTNEVWTLLAVDPNVRVIASGGPLSADLRHFKPGDTLQVGGGLVDTLNNKLVDASSASVVLARQNATTGRVEYLDDTLAWNELAISGGEAAYSHPMVRANTLNPTADPFLWFFIPAADTSGWGYGDMTAVVEMVHTSGTPYSVMANINVFGDANSHDAYALDAVGFALTGGITFR